MRQWGWRAGRGMGGLDHSGAEFAAPGLGDPAGALLLPAVVDAGAEACITD